MNQSEQEIWDFLRRHLQSIFTHDMETYRETTSTDLSLYEWFVTPHRQDGLDFHFFMIDHSWAGTNADFRYDLLEPRLQVYGDTEAETAVITAVISYTFMLTIVDQTGAITHRSHNESRILIKTPDKGWQVVHVHKSPAWQAPHMPNNHHA